jgi:hypothetical protein
MGNSGELRRQPLAPLHRIIGASAIVFFMFLFFFR